MSKQHHFALTVQWTGNLGTGTSAYTAYGRNHTIKAEGKPDLLGSADPAFRGDGTRYNPEDMTISALSSCHMLWYLHLCADAGVIVLDYTDQATGILSMGEGGIGKFTEVTLHPVVTVAEQSMLEKADALHEKAHEFCFIANSVNFPVYHKPLSKI